MRALGINAYVCMVEHKECLKQPEWKHHKLREYRKLNGIHLQRNAEPPTPLIKR